MLAWPRLPPTGPLCDAGGAGLNPLLAETVSPSGDTRPPTTAMTHDHPEKIQFLRQRLLRKSLPPPAAPSPSSTAGARDARHGCRRVRTARHLCRPNGPARPAVTHGPGAEGGKATRVQPARRAPGRRHARARQLCQGPAGAGGAQGPPYPRLLSLPPPGTTTGQPGEEAPARPPRSPGSAPAPAALAAAALPLRALKAGRRGLPLRQKTRRRIPAPARRRARPGGGGTFRFHDLTFWKREIRIIRPSSTSSLHKGEPAANPGQRLSCLPRDPGQPQCSCCSSR